MDRPVRQRNQRGQGGLLRDEILAAAIRVIDQAPNEAEVSLRSIARETGISTMSMYRHFANREELLAAVAEMSWEEVAQQITAASQAGGDPRSRLLLGCRAYVAFGHHHPLRYALMTQVDHTSPAARAALEIPTRGLLACSAPEHLSSAATESQTTAMALSVALHGVAMLHRADTPHLWLSDISTCDIITNLVEAAILKLEHAGTVR